MTEIKYEYELYEPLKKYFEQMGYTVHAEVKGCDMTAVKDNELITLEMKKAFNLKFVYQLADRQGFSDKVYAVIPLPIKYKDTKPMIKLLKLMGVGLITVSQTRARSVNVLLEPKGNVKPNPYKHKRVMREAQERKTSFNTGGTTGRMIVTAFREKSVFALCIIDKLGGKAKTRLINQIAEESLTRLLYTNKLGWFKNISKGEYALSEKGKNAFNDEKYSTLIEFYRKEVEKCLKSEEMNAAGAAAEKSTRRATK